MIDEIDGGREGKGYRLLPFASSVKQPFASLTKRQGLSIDAHRTRYHQ